MFVSVVAWLEDESSYKSSKTTHQMDWSSPGYIHNTEGVEPTLSSPDPVGGQTEDYCI